MDREGREDIVKEKREGRKIERKLEREEKIREANGQERKRGCRWGAKFDKEKGREGGAKVESRCKEEGEEEEE